MLEPEDLVAEGRSVSLIFAKVCHLCCLTLEENNQILSAYSLGLKAQFGKQGSHIY